MLPAELRSLARRVLDAYRRRGLTIATAESCTGGLIAGALTEIAGSSDVVERGFVTYANAAKQEMLGVPEATLLADGAVSEATVRAMAEGALANSPADVAVAVTGVAGPGGGSAEKPVGLVHLATTMRGDGTRHWRMEFGGIGRGAIREATVEAALEMLLERVGESVATRPGQVRLSGLNVVVLFLGAVLAIVLGGMLAFLLVQALGLPRRGTAFLGLMSLVPSLAILLWVYLWIRLKSRRSTTWFGLGEMTLRRLAIGVGGGMAAAAASMAIAFLLRPLVGEPDNIVLKMIEIAGGMSPGLALIILLFAVAAAPVWEELLFRGALYGWCRGRLGVASSALLVALAHALLHLDPAVAPALALIFVWFALLYEWTGNLWVPILAHATNNSLAVLGVWLYLAGWLD